jgi:outer membrane receptor for ferrienterochelin and colicin
VRPAAYVEASYRPIEEILLIPGVRADYTGDGREWTVDPRFTGRFTVAERTTLKTGAGLYSQPAIYYEAMEDLGNPDIKPYHTLQTSLGIEQGIGDSVMFDVDSFYKRWYGRVVGTEGGVDPHFLNEGTGRAYGAEFLVKIRMSEKSRAFLAYTLSRSERQDGADAEMRLFDYDQTHNLSLTASYDLGHGWIAGARFRYGTGNPYSPVVSSVYDANTDTYVGLTDGLNTDRLKPFHQLDVRVEKLWTLGPVGLTTYLEIFNVYNAQNQSGVGYSFDYTESEQGTGMPFFPNLGIRGEL